VKTELQPRITDHTGTETTWCEGYVLNEYGGIGGMKIVRAKLNWRKHILVPYCSPQNPHDKT
jgi:hypothetical protein